MICRQEKEIIFRNPAPLAIVFAPFVSPSTSRYSHLHIHRIHESYVFVMHQRPGDVLCFGGSERKDSFATRLYDLIVTKCDPRICIRAQNDVSQGGCLKREKKGVREKGKRKS